MKKIAAIILLTTLALGCNKKNNNQNAADNPVVSVPVNIAIYPNDPLYFKLQAIGGWMYVDGGINGIVVYRKTEQDFITVERTSSQLPNDANAKVKVLGDNITLRDSVSGSEWRIFDGSVTKGPATWPLRVYGNTYDGNVLRIKN